ncbi:MAG: phosphoenolpyruvate carboxykinase (GTP) [Polyangiaceae bacterium]|nr:phosphoenolpyruvate carboxykinase (GTP) [Polyangiaceae bacterium]
MSDSWSHPNIRNVALERWINEIASHTTPSAIRLEVPDGQSVAPDADTGYADAVEYVSVARPQDSGPFNRWVGRATADERIWPLFRGCMTGRTMFVVPYVLGRPGGYLSRVGVQLTDSPYAAALLRERLWTGSVALDSIGDTSFFARSVHSRVKLSRGEATIVHFPETQEIWSIGSDAPRAALLPRKAHALRLGSQHGLNEGWLAVRGSIVGVEPPGGPKRWLVVAGDGLTPWGRLVDLPSGWRTETATTAACFVYVGRDGRLWAAPAERERGPDVPNREVPVAGFVFTTRRSRVAPLLLEASTWRHGVYLAASLRTERTRSPSTPGILVPDPLCMAQDCGVHMGEYLDHVLSIGRQLAEAPRIFFANTARVGTPAVWWPSGAANVRLLAWIYGRIEGMAAGLRTPIGVVPTPESIDATHLDLPDGLLEQLLAPDGTEWLREVERTSTFFSEFGSKLPNALRAEHRALLARLETSIH